MMIRHGMKKFFGSILLLLLVAVVFMNGGIQARATEKKEAKKAYQKVLISTALKGGKFAAKDINGDGIKELLTWDNTYAVPYAIYTYYNGKVRLLGGESGICSNSFHVYYDKKNKWIVGDNSGTTEMYWCYGVKKGEAVFKRKYAYDLVEEGYILQTQKQTKRISERQFYAYVDTLKEIKPYANTKKNRAKYL